MKLDELARRTGARVVAAGRSGVCVERDQVYAADRMSDLLNASGEHVLLITNLTSASLIRLVELMDVPAVCLAGDPSPEPALLGAAREHGTWLVVSKAGLFETCGRIWAVLAPQAGAA